MTQQNAQLSPETILAEFNKNGVTHVVTLPDSETNWLYLLMDADPTIDIIPVSREGQAMPTAAGLTVGGKKPVILIQNTGLMESGDSIRGWGLGLNTPVVLVVGYRGWTRHGGNRPSDVATFTEPFLFTLGIKYFIVENDEDSTRISMAFEEASNTNRPVAVLIADEYHGFNR